MGSPFITISNVVKGRMEWAVKQTKATEMVTLATKLFDQELRAHFEKDYKVITTDGARIVFPTGWALVRTSNTEPSITYRFESTQSEEDLQRIMGIVRDALAAEGVKANF